MLFRSVDKSWTLSLSILLYACSGAGFAHILLRSADSSYSHHSEHPSSSSSSYPLCLLLSGFPFPSIYFLLPDCQPWRIQLLHMCLLLGYPILQSASTLTTTPPPLRRTLRRENTCTTYFQARISLCLSQKIAKRRIDPCTQSHPTVRANDMSWRSGSPRFELQRIPSTDRKSVV